MKDNFDLKKFLIENQLTRNSKISTSPEVYKLDIENNIVTPSSMDEINKISNRIYDMGGGESSYYDEENIIIIDKISIEDVIEGIKNNSNATKKFYIKFDLKNYNKFPSADKIILSQVIFYFDNIDNMLKTVNDSLNPNGTIDFFSSKMFPIDKQFITRLVNEYNFNLPSDIDINKLSQYKSINIPLSKNNSSIETNTKINKFEIQNIETGKKGIIQYEKTRKGSIETVSGDIDKNDFYYKGKPEEWNEFPEKYPIFIMTPELKYDKNKWYVQEYPKRFKYKFIKKL